MRFMYRTAVYANGVHWQAACEFMAGIRTTDATSLPISDKPLAIEINCLNLVQQIKIDTIWNDSFH
jgi:hypothetical protein